MERKIKFIANVVKWFDKVNGNTYHSMQVIRCSDGKTIYCPFTYGYGDHYRQTALSAMADNRFLPVKYRSDRYCYKYEQENNYPILWNVSEGKKKECIANGKEV